MRPKGVLASACPHASVNSVVRMLFPVLLLSAISAGNGEHSNSTPAEPLADTRVTVLSSRVDLINSSITRGRHKIPRFGRQNRKIRARSVSKWPKCSKPRRLCSGSKLVDAIAGRPSMDDDLDARTARYVAERLASVAIAFAQNPKASVLVIQRLRYLVVGRERSDEQSDRELMEWMSLMTPRETDFLLLRAVTDVVEKVEIQRPDDSPDDDLEG